MCVAGVGVSAICVWMCVSGVCLGSENVTLIMEVNCSKSTLHHITYAENIPEMPERARDDARGSKLLFKK